MPAANMGFASGGVTCKLDNDRAIFNRTDQITTMIDRKTTDPRKI